MEPKSSGQFEQMPVGPEYQPSAPNPEVAKNYDNQLERTSTESGGQEKANAPAFTAIHPTAIALPTPVASQADDTTQAQPDGGPTVAADEDLIEKEWIDKAKKIISDTRDDPYRREREVSKLQSDYLMKRYGKNLGKTD